MYRIDPKNPWPPEIDVTSARRALVAMTRDMGKANDFSEVVIALQEAIDALDRLEARQPKRLSDQVLTHSRFLMDE